MTFDIVSLTGITLSTDLDERAPAVRLDQGRIIRPGKLPLKLDPGESTMVSYPLERRSATYEVIRTS